MLVREEAIHPAAEEVSQSALDFISLNPGESWLAAAARFVRYKRASLADADRPHSTEQTFFWRYISESHLKDLMERLARLLVLSELERNGVLALANVHMAECSETLLSRPVQTHDHMGIDSYARKRR